MPEVHNKMRASLWVLIPLLITSCTPWPEFDPIEPSQPVGPKDSTPDTTPLDMGNDDLPEADINVPDTPPELTPLAPEDLGLMVVSRIGSIDVSWSNVPDARYELQIDGGSWVRVSSTSYQDTEAPGATFRSSRTIAGNAAARDFVALSAGVTSVKGESRSYRVRALDAWERVLATSQALEGSRIPGAISLTWHRQLPGGQEEVLTPQPVATFEDTTAPSDGSHVTYWCQATIEDGASVRCDSAQGSRLAVTQIVTANNHACALFNDGGVKCWGENQGGQLGVGDKLPRSEPAREALHFFAPAVQITTGTSHTCVRFAQGNVLCWGQNNQGQLGFGTEEVLSPGLLFVSLPQGRSAVDIKTRGNHSCALLDDRSLHCWGSNLQGQIGVNLPETVLAPRRVLGGVDEFDVGTNHTCARQGTDVRCWGANNQGQLGQMSGGELRQPPVDPIQAFQMALPVTHVSAGLVNTYAIDTGGNMWSWGSGSQGQLGTGSNPASTVDPMQMTRTYPTLDEIIGGWGTVCALSAGSLYCWGDGTDWLTGPDVAQNLLEPPAQPMNLGGFVKSISLGAKHACALLNGGVVRCWGRNDEGQLGNSNLAQPIGATTADFPPANVVIY